MEPRKTFSFDSSNSFLNYEPDLSCSPYSRNKLFVKIKINVFKYTLIVFCHNDDDENPSVLKFAFDDKAVFCHRQNYDGEKKGKIILFLE